MEFPLFRCPVKVGFPSSTDDYIDLRLDLNELLIKRPSSTLFVRVSEDSMKDVGILDGAILTIDRTLTPDEGRIVIAFVNEECTVKKIHSQGGCIHLLPATEAYKPIVVRLGQDFDIWGVVTHSINP